MSSCPPKAAQPDGGLSGNGLSCVRILAALPLPKGIFAVRPLPLLNGAVLVVKAKVAGREPPLDGAAQRGTSAPAVRVASAGAVARVVYPLYQRLCHARMILPLLEG